MATPIGANTLTSIARHYIMPQITDNIYNSNVLLYRLMKGHFTPDHHFAFEGAAW